jgi:hypothetical protein
MAQPNPGIVSPSTTIVQVDTLQSPYTPIFLSSVSYPGQVVTILTPFSTSQILTRPILLSTNGASFLSGGVSTLLDQPQGYITVQSQSTNTWAFLNSFPFRDQYISAGVYSLTASTLYTAVLSTFIDVTSSLTVENLIVSGTFFQSSGLTLNTSVSSLGAVTLLSSLTVAGSTFLSTHVSSIGPVLLQSTLRVVGDFLVQSSLDLRSSLYVSSSVNVLGAISTPSIRLQGGLKAQTVEIQSRSTTAAIFSGSLTVEGVLSTLSNAFVGGSLVARGLSVGGNLSTLSSLTTDSSLDVSQLTQIRDTLSVLQGMGVGGPAFVSGSVEVGRTLSGASNLRVAHTLQVLSTVSTRSLEAQTATIFKDLAIVSPLGVSTPSLTLRGSLGTGSVQSVSTLVGGTVSTTSSFILASQGLFQESVTLGGALSSLTGVRIESTLSVLGSLGIKGSVGLRGFLTVKDELNVQGTSFLINPPGTSTVVHTDLGVRGALYITDTAILSSITLPETLLAFNFEVSTLQAGYLGIAAESLVSSVHTSSLAGGGLQSTETAFVTSGEISTWDLVGKTLSTVTLVLGASPGPSTVAHVLSSVGIGTPSPSFGIDVAPLVYTTSNTVIGKTISSLTLYGDVIQGTFSGDGTFLSNVNYPEQISTLILSTGSLSVEKTFLSAALMSSGRVTDTFTTYSTLQVGSLYFYGDATSTTLPVSNVILATSQDPTRLHLNNLTAIGDTAGFVTKQVILNESNLPTLDSNIALGVGGTLRLQEYIAPGYNLEILEYRGDVVVAQNIGTLPGTTLYVSSGLIGTDAIPFFIPAGPSPLLVSTNVIQPVGSTLAFNSTLFVTHTGVGVNTQPTYTLDVHSNAVIGNEVISLQSTLIASELSLLTTRSSLWLAVCGTDSNIQASTDEGETWSPLPYPNPFEGKQLLNIGYNGGQLDFTTSNTLTTKRVWVATGVPSLQYLDETTQLWQPATPDVYSFPLSNTSVAFNGILWVLTGTNPLFYPPEFFSPLQWSQDGSTWYPATSGGFTPGAGLSYGGNAVAWNGSVWVAVGQGSSQENSIQWSLDGKVWNDAVSGGFLVAGYGVTWAGSNWAAVGDNGSELRSFLVSPDGSNWTRIDGYGFASIFTGGGRAIASDGQLVVAVGPYKSTEPSASIQLSRDGGYTWSNAQGSLFDLDGYEGSSVVWNGSYWLAGGTDGMRKSFDGVTWTRPAFSPSFPFLGLAYSSNAQPTLVIGDSNYAPSPSLAIETQNQLRVYNTPGANVLSRGVAPTLSYTSTSLTLMNTLTIDRFKNVGIQSLPVGTVSTLYSPGLATVSTGVSTHSLQVGFYSMSIGLL